MPLFPESTPAKTTRLPFPQVCCEELPLTLTGCSLNLHFGPSVSLLLTCKWGIVSSNSNRNRIPNQKPIKPVKKRISPYFPTVQLMDIKTPY